MALARFSRCLALMVCFVGSDKGLLLVQIQVRSLEVIFLIEECLSLLIVIK